MKKRITWLAVSCLMVAALVLASCAPKEEVITPKEEVVAPKEEVVTPKEEVVTPKEEVVTPKEEVVAPSLEAPKYGGVLKLGQSASPTAFDQCVTPVGGYEALWGEDLIGGDWSKGQAGSGASDFAHMLTPDDAWSMGLLAESWEHPEPETIIFHIRKGVHFALDPKSEASRLVAGREMNANDVVYSLMHVWNCPRSNQANQFPWDKTMVSLTAPDKWTVVLKTKPGWTGQLWANSGDVINIIPHEVVEKYGDINNWKNVVGTGAFMLTDYVRDSSATLVRNPNYWMTDPVGPGKGNQLPYLDGVKFIVMPDLSTRMSALRTAKVDQLRGVGWEDAKRFREAQPELKYLKYYEEPWAVFMKVDNPQLPYYDKKVRQALSMAINRQEIAKTFHGGEANVYSYPIGPIIERQAYIYPFEKLPEATRELLEYHPDKAKQLLAEAGYPNGFKTEVVATAAHVDLLSIVKEYWKKIGVDLSFDVKEAAVYSSMGYARTHKEMYFGSVGMKNPDSLQGARVGDYQNRSNVNDPRLEAAYMEIQDGRVFFDPAKRYGKVTELTPYLIDQTYFVVLPTYYSYTFWWPWVKNYHGEYQVGATDSDNWAQWVWLDQDLKEEMTGRR